MNNETQSPLIPQGSLEQKKNQGRARVKLVISVVLAVHGIALIAMLMAGCQKEKDPAAQVPAPDTQEQAQASTASTNQPQLDAPTNAAAADTNTAAPAPATAAAPTPPAPPAPEPAALAPAAGTQDYKVAAGDTFSTIAHKNHVSVKSLMAANPNISPTKLQIGQVLKVPAPTTAAPTAGASAGAAGAETASSDANIYTVKSGDTLTTVAKKHGVSVRSLRSANNLTTDRIKVGDKLKIPAKATTATTTAATNPPTQ